MLRSQQPSSLTTLTAGIVIMMSTWKRLVFKFYPKALINIEKHFPWRYKKKVVQELELRIWGCSLSIEQQNMDNVKDAEEDNEGEDIQKELWKLIKGE